jgi:predicted O-methyltransferase YrrM
MARKHKAEAYSIDHNPDKIADLKSNFAEQVAGVEFVESESIRALGDLSTRYCQIDFLFLDSASSAMHTFREFQIVEQRLGPGSILLVDNAAVPGESGALGKVRKGKILVPYLLASAYWEVRGYPYAGDSMVAAVCRNEGHFADPDYEAADNTLDSRGFDAYNQGFYQKLNQLIKEEEEGVVYGYQRRVDGQRDP